MVKIQALIIVIALLTPLASSTNCSTASQSECGVAGTTCQYYMWSNSTNGTCIAPSICPLSPDTTVWSNATSNCIPCINTDSNLCQSCLTYNFYYSTKQGACLSCANSYGPLCETCDATQCKTCSSGYSLTNDSQSCINTNCSISNCISCQSSTQCKTCATGLIPYNGYCVCSITNCEICSSGVCLQCVKGFSTDSSKLKCNLICIENCISCKDVISCSACVSGYKYDSSVNQCKVDCSGIDNCITCSSTSFCTSCSSNYTLSLSGICNLKCADANCISCASTNNCTLCKPGYKYKFNNASNTSSCSIDICTIDYCISCSSATKCSQCASFSILASDGSCTPNCNKSNCAYCASSSACQTCYDGYKVTSGDCVPICTISNCKLCGSASGCLECQDRFILSNGGQNCDYDCPVLGCINCNSSTTCSECYSGSTLVEGGLRCEVSCASGYFLNSSSNACTACPTSNCLTCDSIGRCLSCASLFYRNNTDFSCTPCSSISNCFDCEKGEATCTICKAGFSLLNGACVSQAGCLSNCQTCAANSTTTCLICNSGYSLGSNGTICTQIQCPSGQYLMGSTCTCGPKSYFANGNCAPCNHKKCISCTSKICLQCAVGFYADGTACVACSSNCILCDSFGCLTCRSGFFKSGNTCQSAPSAQTLYSVSRTGDVISCPTGCKSCDINKFNNIVCRQASNGYVLIKGVIYKCSSTCLTCAETLVSGIASICLSCPNGYSYAYGTCTKCTGNYSVTCLPNNAYYSLSCLPGFTAKNGECKACGLNCIKCDIAGADKCDAGGCKLSALLKADGCLPCFKGCYICAADPNICMQCSDYYYLSNNTCQLCSANCKACTSATSCTSCQSGYYLINNTCQAPPNISNCISFDSSLTNCTKCDFNYNLSQNACVIDILCNANSTCIACPYNYYLSSGKCLNCPQIANCKSCQAQNSTQCIDCTTGFYNSNGACQACSIPGCMTCTSSTICAKAADGYFLVLDITGAYTGGAEMCGGKCATCLTSRLNCITCQSGSSLRGSQCISNDYQSIKLVTYLKQLGQNSTESKDSQTGLSYNYLNSFAEDLRKALGYTSIEAFRENVLIQSIAGGSVVINMVTNKGASPNDPSVISKVASNSFGIVNVDITNSSNPGTSTNLGLILGVSIPLGLILIIIIVLIAISKDQGSIGKKPKTLSETDKEIQKFQPI